ncbi:MAG: anhydro-N-acetylmuramic acid kinase [Gammaproteobacteria bacterium]|nr:anhydro-N-acetylmuramic acid kinase [Gammaproteobacteria bacterium]
MAELYIGLMSGTSCDGTDAVLVDFAPATGSHHPEVLAHHYRPYPEPLRQAVLDLASAATTHEIALLGPVDRQLGLEYSATIAELLAKSQRSADTVIAIGCHGQTIRHQPRLPLPFTLQIGDANTVAQQTRITTVADFRRRDIAAGGEGAPLVPAFHAALFRHPQHNRVIVNIGGIANITLLPADLSKPVSGFDCGPGNCLLDSWIARHHGTHYDDNGAWGRQGRLLPELLDTLLNDPFFSRPPPKSTGRELFNLSWLEIACQRLADTTPPAAVDIQATLHELTAAAITTAIRRSLPEVNEVIACGGGCANHYLWERLQLLLGNEVKLSKSSHYGYHPMVIEAVAFAWLARETLHGRCGNLPAVTNASEPVILGAIYPGDHFYRC